MPQFYDQDRENAAAEPRRRNRRSAEPSPFYRPRRRRSLLPLFLFAAVLLAAIVIALAAWRPAAADPTDGPDAAEIVPSHTPAPTPSPTAPPPAGNNVTRITVPDWITQDILPLNEYSRPGDALPQVNGVVVHYTGNPGTTAEQNRNYFADLAVTHQTWASSHFVIGIDGKIIQCVPLDEISYCSNDRNADTIAIECCHLDDTGKFTQETTRALVKLLDWLIDTYGLERGDILRHYDVTGKECPRYFARDPGAWEAFLDQLTF